MVQTAASRRCHTVIGGCGNPGIDMLFSVFLSSFSPCSVGCLGSSLGLVGVPAENQNIRKV